jgi:hypothetical protein
MEDGRASFETRPLGAPRDEDKLMMACTVSIQPMAISWLALPAARVSRRNVPFRLGHRPGIVGSLHAPGKRGETRREFASSLPYRLLACRALTRCDRRFGHGLTE